jgi:hypothetical protein
MPLARYALQAKFCCKAIRSPADETALMRRLTLRGIRLQVCALSWHLDESKRKKEEGLVSAAFDTHFAGARIRKKFDEVCLRISHHYII